MIYCSTCHEKQLLPVFSTLGMEGKAFARLRVIHLVLRAPVKNAHLQLQLCLK